MLYEANTPAGFEIELVYHCRERREVVVKWVNTVAKQYEELTNVILDRWTVKTARCILVADKVIYIDPQPGQPFPDVSKLRHRKAKQWK